MKLYTIYDPDSNLYVTKGLRYKLEELNSRTLFFDTYKQAQAALNQKQEYSDKYRDIEIELAFWLLSKFHKNLEKADISKEEFSDAIYQFRHLKVQRLCIGRMDG